jgi:predicted ATPase
LWKQSAPTSAKSWPEWPEEAARARLRNTLANLRQILGDAQTTASPFLLITRETVQFNGASDYSLDVRAFADLCDAGRWEEGIALYRGEFLEGLSLKDSAPFEDWALLTRERLRQQYLRALRRLAAQCEQHGDRAGAEKHLRRLLELEPWDEEGHRGLMRLLAASGQRSAALAQYEKCVESLRAELGAEPEAETTRLYEQIRGGQVGEARAERPASHLPTPLLPLIGREEELGQVLACLRDPRCRLLSLVGPGGAGKTRLALEAAGKLEGQFARGAHFAPLSAVETVEGMVPAIAQGVGFSFYNQPGSTPRQQLLGYFRGKEMLLLLDNCEHLLDGAGLITEILEVAPGSKVLATTRARLALLGEQCLMLGGLECPALTQKEREKGALPSTSRRGAGGEGYPAVQLFLESAQRVRPGYQPSGEELTQIAQICRWVEGMPLAILLASSWMGMLSPSEIVAQMARADGQRLDLLQADYRDLPERQRSMRAVLDQSWRLLAEREQGILAALSVFHGSFSAEAAQAVAGASLRDLLRLVDRSLLQRSTEGRCALHDLLRRYAAEKLAAADQATAALDRHAAHYARTLEAWAADIYSPRQAAFVRAMAQEYGDIVAAWEWAVRRARLDWLDQMQDSLTRWHVFQGRHPEADRLLSPAIAAAERVAPLGKQARVLAGLLGAQSVLQYVMGDSSVARAQLERCFALLEKAEQAGEDVHYERLKSLRRMGYVAPTPAERISFQERALEAARALGNRAEEAQALMAMGMQLSRQGQRQKGWQLYETAAAIFRELGHYPNAIKLRFSQVTLAHEDGRWGDMPALVSELQALAQAVDFRGTRVNALQALGYGLLGLGRQEEALAAFEQCIALCEELGNRSQLLNTMWLFAHTLVLSGRYAEGREYCLRMLPLAQQANHRSAQLMAYADPLLAALAENRPDVDEWWNRYAEFCERAGEKDGYFHLRAAGVACWRGQWAEARRALSEALRDSFLSSSPIRLGQEVLPCLALVWAREGQVERAVELYALCDKVMEGAPGCPAIEDQYGRPIREAAKSLPPEVVAAAQERGRARDWESTAKELLAELEQQKQD